MGSGPVDISASGKHWRVGEGFVDHLHGAVLYRVQYEQLSDDWDHDHCVVCETKFMIVAPTDHSQKEAPLTFGYSTTLDHRPETEWICEECGALFESRFAWRVEAL